MKNIFIIFVMVMASTNVLAATSTVYHCQGGRVEPLTVEVIDQEKLIINNQDTGTIDFKYADANPEKKTYRLIGKFGSLGDGAEGYNVDVTVSKYFFNNSNVAYLNTYNRGPDGYYKESYKCTRARQ